MDGAALEVKAKRQEGIPITQGGHGGDGSYKVAAPFRLYPKGAHTSRSSLTVPREMLAILVTSHPLNIEAGVLKVVVPPPAKTRLKTRETIK